MASIASMTGMGFLALVCGCAAGPARPGSAGAAGNVVVVGGDVWAVAEAFNAHADRVRVIEIVSPVCEACLLGARCVNERVVKVFGEEVATIVVWIPMVEGDCLKAARKSAEMYPSGVAQFYDNKRRVGWAYTHGPFKGAREAAWDALPEDHWIRSVPSNRNERPMWDAYFAYAPGVRWESAPPMPTAWVRHLGMDENGKSWFWRDTYSVPPVEGDLAEAIGAMMASIATPAAARIELLGFPGCPNTPAMRQSLAGALERVGGGLAFVELNQEVLPAEDARRGFAAPTVLVNGNDLFGMAVQPGTPLRCRIYPGGVPGPDMVAGRLRQALGR